MPNPLAVKQLYERRVGLYSAFIGLFRSRRGLQALLERSDLLRPRTKVLDAGCGFGTATFALLDAMRTQGIGGAQVEAFDLTPGMLSRFSEELATRNDAHVSLREANMLDEDALPATWCGYDLVLSTSMLEYLPREQLPRALAALRARMAPQGRMLVMITRRSPEAKLLIEWGWHAERYSVDELRHAFAQAGFGEPRFIRFPLRYGWLNRANHVAVAPALV
jgi:SAM-dependent methyltransferase